MSVKLLKSSYGKASVRVMKLTKHEAYHEIKELTVRTTCTGDFTKAHKDGDNRDVLPTDTQKNTIYIMAKLNPINTIEDYALALAKHFIDNNPQMDSVEVEVEQHMWQRMPVDGKEHPQAYQRGGDEKWTCKVEHSRTETKITSGVKDWLILKTTKSGFSDFKVDAYTTLKDTKDRIFCTRLKAEWAYSFKNIDFATSREKIHTILAKVFSDHDSLSVQHTLYAMGEEVLNQVAAIHNIDFDMPNKHNLLVNLSAFDLENDNEVFHVTDEPYGVIQGTMGRGDAG